MSVDKRDLYPPESTSKKDRAQRQTHPKGWTPGLTVEETDKDGSFRSGIVIPAPQPVDLNDPPDPNEQPWDKYIARYGIDPRTVDVIPPIQITFWQGMVKNEILMEQGKVAAREGRPFEYDEEELTHKTDLIYFKARIVAKNKPSIEEDEKKWIRKWKPLKSRPKPKSDKTLVVCWSDWQIGKDDGDGVRGTVDRILNSFEQTVQAIKEIGPDKVLVLSLGDMIESCNNHYAQQSFRVEMNLREQEQTVRRLIVRGLKEISDVAQAVEVAVVGGNHGENRNDGKSFTDFADNFDVGVYEAVKDQLSENPDRFNNIVFRIPQEDLTQTIDEKGHIIGIYHGHQVKSATYTALDNWIRKQAVARTAIGDADILLNGHFHHFFWRSMGPRHHLQAPTLDGGSLWFNQVGGGNEPPGTLIFTVDERPLNEGGLENVRILPAKRTERPDKWGDV